MAYKFDGPSVGFYRGTQANLDKLSTYKDGAFYITTDTDRLYYAQANNELVYLNKSITVVPTQTELFKIDRPAKDEFYYVTEGNILCYFAPNNNGTKEDGDWIQVNAQPDLDDYCKNFIEDEYHVSSIDITDGEVVGDEIQFNVTVTQSDKNGDTVDSKEVTDKFTISGDSIRAFIEHPKNEITIDAAPDASNDKYTVTLGGSDATKDLSYTVKVENGLSIDSSSSNDNIVIKGTTYKFGNTGAKLQLKDQAGNEMKSPVEILANKLTATSTAETADLEILTKNSTDSAQGEIAIKHKKYNYTASGIANQTPAHGGSFNIIKDITTTNGHVTGVSTATVTLPDVSDIEDSIDELSRNDIASVDIAGGTLTLTRVSGEADDNLVAEDALYYTINGDTYYNQDALDAGIQKYIQDNLSDITNTMTFKGGLTGGSDNSPIAIKAAINTLNGNTDIAIGDTYIVKSGTIAVTDAYDNKDTKANAGDIIISNSDDIDNPKWIVIEGTEKDTTYEVKAIGNAISLLPDGTGAVSSAIDVEGGNKIAISTTGKTTTANSKLTISHANLTPEELSDDDGEDIELENGDDFTVITGVNRDAAGHVTGVITTKVVLPDYDIDALTNVHQFKGTASDNKVELIDCAGVSTGSHVIITEGTAMDVALTTSSDNKENTFTVSHANVGHTPTNVTAAKDLTNGETFTALEGITVNEQGHVVAFTTKKYKAINTDTNTTYKLEESVVDNKDNSVKFAANLKVTEGAAAGTADFTLKSANDNLTVTATNDVISVGMVWGTF